MNRRATFWLLIGLQLVYLLFVFVWLFAAAVSTMGMNDSSVFRETSTWLYIAYLLAYPLGLLAAMTAGWVLYRRARYKAALWWNAFPALWIASLVGIFVYASIS